MWKIEVQGKIRTDGKYAKIISDIVRGLGQKVTEEIDERGYHILYLPNNLVTDSLHIAKRLRKLLRQLGVPARLRRVTNHKLPYSVVTNRW